MTRRNYAPKHPNSHRKFYEVSLPFDYETRPVNDPKELIILLHGYSETGKKILDKLKEALPQNAYLLAPNAPFPIPFKIETGYQMGCSWYFYDFNNQEYYIDMKITLGLIERLVHDLSLSHLPKRIIGFSQGGYLAPFVGALWKNTQQVIGIGCEYLVEEWPSSHFRVDGIHGQTDPVIRIESAKKTFSDSRGQFHELTGVGHKIDEKVRSKIQELIQL